MTFLPDCIILYPYEYLFAIFKLGMFTLQSLNFQILSFTFIAQPKGKSQRIKSTVLEVVIYQAIDNVTLVFDDNEY